MVVETRRRMFVVDPTAKPVAAEFAGAPRLRDLAGLRIGLIDDSKKNAREFLEEVADALNRRLGVASVKYHAKPSASKPAEPSVIEEMARECDYVIVGVGD